MIKIIQTEFYGAGQKASSYALFEEFLYLNGRVNKKQWCNLQLPTNA